MALDSVYIVKTVISGPPVLAWKTFKALNKKTLTRRSSLAKDLMHLPRGYDYVWEFNQHGSEHVVKRGEWLTANVTKVAVNDAAALYYHTGFHAYIFREEAVRQANIYGSFVVPVKVMSITLVGRQFESDILVAGELYVPKNKKEFEEVLKLPPYAPGKISLRSAKLKAVGLEVDLDGKLTG